MKRSILVLMMILIGLSIVWVNGKNVKHPANEPYTPTQMEWFLMELRTALPSNFDNIDIAFYQDLDYPGKVQVIFLHDSSDPYQKLKSLGDKYAKSILTRAKLREWDWIKVKLVYKDKQNESKKQDYILK